MNKIQSLAKEMKLFFSPEIVTDVYGICKQFGIEIIEAPIKADAYLECENGNSYIVLKESLNDNRKKFTIAHELGHFYIPWHSELMFGCDIKEMDFKIGVAFAKDASSLKHGKNTDYNMEIEECQNISMREDMETIENILDQVIEARSVVVLSDFSLERQMEIAGEASLEHFEEILDLLLQKQSESDLVVGSVTCYEGTLEDRANRIEQRRQKYSEYEQKCLEEIEQLTKQRDEALEKQEVKK